MDNLEAWQFTKVQIFNDDTKVVFEIFEVNDFDIKKLDVAICDFKLQN